MQIQMKQTQHGDKIVHLYKNDSLLTTKAKYNRMKDQRNWSLTFFV